MADDRTYVKLHDGFDEHPKVAGLSDKEFRTYVEALCYSARNLTDGAISFAVARKLAPPRVFATLLRVGLFERHNDHYAVHDYLEHQRSAEQVKQLKEARREAGKRGGNAKAKGLASARGVASGLLKQTPSKVVPETESLTYVRDQAETNPSLRSGTKESTNAARTAPRNAGQIVEAWIDTLNRRPPSNVVGQVAKHIKVLLEDNFAEPEILAGLATMSTKGLHPSTLPSLVNDVVNRPKLTSVSNGQPTLNDDQIENLIGYDGWALGAPPDDIAPDIDADAFHAWAKRTVAEHRAQRLAAAHAKLNEQAAG